MTSLDENIKQLNDATIMIVDDEPSTIEIVEAFLEEEGYHNFIRVDDSTMAMGMIEKNRPDLLLLDLMMPEVSGFDILSSARVHPKFKYLPVIILTGSSDTQNKLKALGLGATDFLAKPLDQSELVLRVRNNLAAKAYQDQLAYYDILTKLPNRQFFLDVLSWALNPANGHNKELALLKIEIDNFDKISDTMGVSVGEEVVRLFANRILTLCKEMDFTCGSNINESDDLILFHMDKTSFSMLLNSIQGPENAAIAAETILKNVSAPMHIAGREIYVTASIGIVTYPADSDDSFELMRRASSAKEHARKMGGNSFQFYSSEINKIYEKRLALESKLRKAIEKDEFFLYYQPKIDVQTGIIQGVEALLRLKNNEEFISPEEFIPLAEETGLIVSIGEWVLRQACSQLFKLQEAGYKNLSVAVNLSARQFTDPEFLSTIKKIVASSSIDTRFLMLEITESILLGDIDEKIKLLRSLKGMGMKLSIDDFGTGYSSLNYLRKLPVDELKIDRSFIMEVLEYADSRAIVSTIVFLAKSLNLSTVAEGIEKKEELEFLQTLGCNQYQGFFFSPPLPINDLHAFLLRRNKE